MENGKNNPDNVNYPNGKPVVGACGVYDPHDTAYGNIKPNITYLDTHEIKWGAVALAGAGVLTMATLAKKLMKPASNGKINVDGLKPAGKQTIRP